MAFTTRHVAWISTILGGQIPNPQTHKHTYTYTHTQTQTQTQTHPHVHTHTHACIQKGTLPYTYPLFSLSACQVMRSFGTIGMNLQGRQLFRRRIGVGVGTAFGFFRIHMDTYICLHLYIHIYIYTYISYVHEVYINLFVLISWVATGP